MTELEAAGWKKAEEKTADQVKGYDLVCISEIFSTYQVTDVDIKSIFNLVDIDKSGTVSRTVSFFNLLLCWTHDVERRKSYKICTI